MRVLVDSNIVISAIGWDGNERKLLFTEHNIDVDFFICEKTIEEFTSVLERKKFSHLDRKKVTRFTLILLDLFTIVSAKGNLKIVKEDPDDDVIINCAIDNKIEYVVTGNNHLLKLKEFKGIKILKTIELLKIFGE